MTVAVPVRFRTESVSQQGKAMEMNRFHVLNVSLGGAVLCLCDMVDLH
jgi:hypothetical protein